MMSVSQCFKHVASLWVFSSVRSESLKLFSFPGDVGRQRGHEIHVTDVKGAVRGRIVTQTGT